MVATIMEEKIWKLFQMKIREEELKKGWREVYDYLENHSVLDTKRHYGDGIIEMIKGHYEEKGSPEEMHLFDDM